MSNTSAMENIKDVFVSPAPDSQYFRPLRFHYTQAGRVKAWDLLDVHDSVGVIVFNTDRKVLVCCKQFRPALYFNNVHPRDREDSNEINTNKYPASLGVSLEMCAGLVDKGGRTALEIARNELIEELGYEVSLGALEKIMSYRSDVGIQSSLQTMFYCEVTDDMKVGKGGGVGNELIETVELTIPEVERLVQRAGPHNSPPSCLFALVWFLYFKAKRFTKSFDRYCVECKPKF